MPCGSGRRASSTLTEQPDEPTREDKRNAILTYREVNTINVTLQRLETKMDAMKEDIEDVKKVHDDHEVRIRALELSHARLGGGSGMASFLWQAVWPAAAVIISLLAYLQK